MWQSIIKPNKANQHGRNTRWRSHCSGYLRRYASQENKLIRSLRKGNTTIELWHSLGSDTVGAINTEIELKESYAIFRTTLKPIDGNQKSDVDNVFIENIGALKEITFDDAQIRKATAKFLKAYKEKIGFIKLNIIYNKGYEFNVSLNPIDKDGLSFEITA